MKRFLAAMLVVAVMGCTQSKPAGEMSSAGPQAQTTAVDLHNTVCPVSGDQVDDSKLTQTYNGKIYHLCCSSCAKPFNAHPEKYEAAVMSDPAKYGVKPDAEATK